MLDADDVPSISDDPNVEDLTDTYLKQQRWAVLKASGKKQQSPDWDRVDRRFPLAEAFGERLVSVEFNGNDARSPKVVDKMERGCLRNPVRSSMVDGDDPDDFIAPPCPTFSVEGDWHSQLRISLTDEKPRLFLRVDAPKLGPKFNRALTLAVRSVDMTRAHIGCKCLKALKARTDAANFSVRPREDLETIVFIHAAPLAQVHETFLESVLQQIRRYYESEKKRGRLGCTDWPEKRMKGIAVLTRNAVVSAGDCPQRAAELAGRMENLV